MRLIRRARAVRRSTVVLAMLVTVAFTATSATPAVAITADQKTILELTNADRANHHRPALKLDKQLSKYATKHSRKMANRGVLFHTPDLSDVLHGVHWSHAGENIGFTAGDLEGMEDAWMHSPDHKKNILSTNFDHVAVGQYIEHGHRWITVIFYG